MLTGATVHPVSGADLADAQVLFDGGRIRAIGRNLALPPNTQVIDVRGKHVYPGLVATDTVLGLVEISSVRATVDTREVGAINPNARAEVSINPDSELLSVARTNGVLTALSAPQGGSGTLVSGTSALVKLDGWTWEDMTLRAPVGLHIRWPQLAINDDPRFPKSPADQRKDAEKQLRQIKDTFDTARAYLKARRSGDKSHEIDLRWEAMIPVLDGKIPVFVHADEVKQIQSALAWAEAEKLSLVLVGATDAWRVAARLKERNIPVIVSPVMRLPLRRSDPYDAPYTNPAKLQAAGVRFALSTDSDDAHLARNLPYQAAMAASFGLPKEEALKAITLYPAQILGLGDRLGSLEVGKDATVIVTDGDPLEITTHVELAFIQGRAIDLGNRQWRLYRKYQQKYEQQKRSPAIRAGEATAPARPTASTSAAPPAAP